MGTSAVPVGPFVRRSLTGSPRRSLTIVVIVAIVVAIIATQVQVAAGLQRSVRGALATESGRTLVVAAPLATWGPPSLAATNQASARIGELGGVVEAGTAVRFVDVVAAGPSNVAAQSGWADPVYLSLVTAGDRFASVTAGGAAALLPAALRRALGSRIGDRIHVGPTTLVDLGDAPSSFADPGLRDTALVPVGVVGAGASLDGGTVLAAVLFDSVPSDRDVASVSAALSPEAPAAVAVVSRGSASTSAGRIDALAGTSGRIAVWIVSAAGWVIVMALQLTMVQRRRGELAIRRALGATARDLAAASVAESAALGAAGGLVGAVLANAVLALVAAQGTVGVGPFPMSTSGWATLGGAVATMLAGVPPTVAAVASDPADVLRSLGDT